MTREHQGRGTAGRSTVWTRDEQAAAVGPVPGKRTLTEMLPPASLPVQRKIDTPASGPRPAIEKLALRFAARPLSTAYAQSGKNHRRHTQHGRFVRTAPATIARRRRCRPASWSSLTTTAIADYTAIADPRHQRRPTAIANLAATDYVSGSFLTSRTGSFSQASKARM